MTNADAPFLRACRREKTAFTPVWLMRQAGRYMPEYRALRAKHAFLDLCKTPAAAAEVTLQPVERIGVDAAILFADILLVLEPLGVGLEFTRGEGPHIPRPIRSAADVARLPPVDVASAVGYVFETVRLARRALAGRLPLIGFAGAPFTLASYLIEGGASRDFLHTKRFMRAEPAAWHALMGRLAATGDYLNGQIAAGVQAVQLFDSWVGTLSLADYREFALPHTRAVFRRLDAGAPAIHFGTGTAAAPRGDAGSRRRRDRPRLARGSGRGLGPPGRRRGAGEPRPRRAPRLAGRDSPRARAVLDGAAGRPGHIFNLGHGVHAETPVDHVRALVDMVHDMSSR